MHIMYKFFIILSIFALSNLGEELPQRNKSLKSENTKEVEQSPNFIVLSIVICGLVYWCITSKFKVRDRRDQREEIRSTPSTNEVFMECNYGESNKRINSENEVEIYEDIND